MGGLRSRFALIAPSAMASFALRRRSWRGPVTREPCSSHCVILGWAREKLSRFRPRPEQYHQLSSKNSQAMKSCDDSPVHTSSTMTVSIPARHEITTHQLGDPLKQTCSASTFRNKQLCHTIRLITSWVRFDFRTPAYKLPSLPLPLACGRSAWPSCRLPRPVPPYRGCRAFRASRGRWICRSWGRCR
jgi:hypothetical protein